MTTITEQTETGPASTTTAPTTTRNPNTRKNTLHGVTCLVEAVAKEGRNFWISATTHAHRSEGGIGQ